MKRFAVCAKWFVSVGGALFDAQRVIAAVGGKASCDVSFANRHSHCGIVLLLEIEDCACVWVIEENRVVVFVNISVVVQYVCVFV